MTPSAIARRAAVAQQSITESAAAIAAQNPSLDASGLGAAHRNPQMQAMLRLEALAEFLAALAAAPVAPEKATKRGKKDESDA